MLLTDDELNMVNSNATFGAFQEPKGRVDFFKQALFQCRKYCKIPYGNGVICNIYELTAGSAEQVRKSLCRASFIDAGIVSYHNSKLVSAVKDLEIHFIVTGRLF